MKQALLIFVKNTEKGKVKTRLAATVGDEVALFIYQKLLNHTQKCTQALTIYKIVYYADYIENNDVFSHLDYEKKLQIGNDLGERMQKAFIDAFENGYDKVAIIGSDCFEITTEIIEYAYLQLSKNDVVIGPALDGGYYLIALKLNHKSLFENINWSTHQVLTQTINICNDNGLKVFKLRELSDIDTEDDLKRIGYNYSIHKV